MVKSPKNGVKIGKSKVHVYIMLIPLCAAFLALFIFGPSVVGEWVSTKLNGILGHVGIEWFREENRELGIIAIIVSLIVIYKIILSAKK